MVRSHDPQTVDAHVDDGSAPGPEDFAAGSFAANIGVHVQGFAGSADV